MDWILRDVGVQGANPLSEESDSRDNRVGVTRPVIELATIDERHGCSILLDQFGAKALLRLAVVPVQMPQEVLKRAVTVDRISPASGGERWEEVREIGWSGLSDLRDRCEQILRVVNEHHITEFAAIGVALLLIHELEGAVLTGVLPIGSGGDYLVKLSDRPEPVQMEASGIKEGSASQAASRLGEKCRQIRGAGFVSVTTFQHSDDGGAHSYLHFIVPEAKANKAERRRPKGWRGRRS
jgi:hypothetical protein